MAVRTTGEKVFGLFNSLFLILFSLTILFPFVNLLAISLTHGSSEYLSNVMLWPRPLSTKSYEVILGDSDLYWGYLNTIVRTVAGTFATVVVLLCAAYPLSKKYLPHRNVYTSIFVFTLFFSGGLIPTYMLIRSLGLIDTRLVFILLNLAPAFWLLIMRNFLMTIPAEIEDSARIDGANEIVVLFRIIAPMSTAVIATIGLWSAVGHWKRVVRLAHLYQRSTEARAADLAAAHGDHRQRQAHHRGGAGVRRGVAAAGAAGEPQLGGDLRRHRADPHRLSVHPEILREGGDNRVSQGVTSPRRPFGAEFRPCVLTRVIRQAREANTRKDQRTCANSHYCWSWCCSAGSPSSWRLRSTRTPARRPTCISGTRN